MIWFEWDETKAFRNVRKHAISFEIAKHVFDDPDALVERDYVERGEPRWRTIGLVENTPLLLLVVHTVDPEAEDEITRIVPARRAGRKERRRCEKERQKNRG